jgi:hypothetical protein
VISNQESLIGSLHELPDRAKNSGRRHPEAAVLRIADARVGVLCYEERRPKAAYGYEERRPKAA